MDTDKISLLIEKVKDAELVLVGIGEECDINKNDFENAQTYKEIVNSLGDNAEKIIPYVKRELIETNVLEVIDDKSQMYQNLLKLIGEKNYFVVSLCTDGLIEKAGFDPKRIVEPCGNYNKLQCAAKCTADLYEIDERVSKQIEKLKEKSVNVELPVCPKCGNPLIFNNIDAGSDYVEEGYLEQWQIYTKWLQGTVNCKVCIIELGVGMKFPSVIRWPFEKVAFFNQKASFFRVHSRLYQMTEEVKDKGCGIKALPDDFLKELSNRL